MSSLDKKAKTSGSASSRRSRRPAGLPRPDTDVIFSSSDKQWMQTRIANMERILATCKKDPHELVGQMRELLREQAAIHERAGRNTDALFYAQLDAYASNLQKMFRKNGIRP